MIGVGSFYESFFSDLSLLPRASGWMSVEGEGLTHFKLGQCLLFGTVTPSQAFGEIAEPGIGDEAADASQERKAGTFDGGLHPGFDQGEGLERVARDGAFVTELDQPVGNVCGIKSEVFGIEPLAGKSKGV